MGLLTYNKGFENSVNIGDYIQSLAAKSFYDAVDIYLEREDLNNYNQHFKTKIILNGWFLHCPENWPPSDGVVPKIISFHIHPNSASQMLKPEGIAFLKKYSPVGCRDHWTKALLSKYGIPCYFSGCLTLTLGRKYQENVGDGKIYFVDLPLGYIKRSGIIKLMFCIPIVLRSLPTIIKIYKNQKRTLFHALAFYCTFQKMFADDILANGEFINHSTIDTFPDDAKRYEYAEELIKKYAKAGLVVTSRLHCALPCLGLETPVIFVPTDIMDARFGGLKELLRIITWGKNGLETEDDVLKNIPGKISRKTKIRNKDDYLLLKAQLEKECIKFMSNE
jgi:hypothetical protein